MEAIKARAILTHKNKVRVNDPKLSKRLAYILRYGAEKEGLSVSGGGWVALQELLKVPLMRGHCAYGVLQEVRNSLTHRGLPRYEMKNESHTVYVRAIYGRRMERNPYHEGTNVPRLVERCFDFVLDNLDDYDFTDFPDEHLLNGMIHKLRQAKRLSNRALKTLLSPCIEHLDLGACYIVESTLKQLPVLCPNLRVLNLRDCGYILNDHLFTQLIKKSTELESLNLACCHHLTDTSVRAICKHGLNIQKLNLSSIPGITQTAILHLVTAGPPNLCHLDIFDCVTVDDEGRDVLAEVAEKKAMTIVLEGLDADFNSQNKSNGDLSLALASVGNLW